MKEGRDPLASSLSRPRSSSESLITLLLSGVCGELTDLLTTESDVTNETE